MSDRQRMSCWPDIPGGVLSYQPPGHPVYQVYRDASPLSYVDSEDPPFLVFHCTEDPVVSVQQSHALAAALSAAGVPYEFHALADGDHAAVFSLEEFVPMSYAAEWLLQQLPR